ncbi:putative phage-associated protein [Phyllobacterium trifolii]|uniref:Putative phage-associated protein n=1 Tax=Phyllobacterium trifolii TaxID=300193 RepID=A0A839U8T2_9HYPH|nr:Panacea domain-containing protein [Phyllobacterium trifolii]MBB3146385.1 putative phage-associated protein [Phyllobacterium trifolii]
MSYEPKKAAQLIASLIIKSGGQSLNILKAVKLVYLIDRESIQRFGFPILDETRVSMPKGPVNSTTYSHINGEYDLDECGWSEFLEDRENHKIALAAEGISIDDLDELSDADIQCVEAVWDKFGQLTQWELVEWTHDPKNIPEWEDPNGGSTVIPLQRILHAVGVEDAEDFVDTAKAHRAIDKSFERARVH